MLRYRNNWVPFFALMVVGSIVTVVFFSVVDGIYHHRTIAEAIAGIEIWNFQTLGTPLVLAICLTCEAMGLGWESSSLARLLDDDSPSTKIDRFYVFLFVSNFASLYGFFLTLGLAYYVNRWFADFSSVALFRQENFWASMLLLLIVNPFIFYVYHRFAHTKFMWEFHKIHHSATHMNMVTAFRNHPIDSAFRPVLLAIPAALFGVNPYAVATYAALNGIYQLLVHSEMDWGGGWIEQYVLIGPRAHRLHHSTNPEHAGKNLGVLVLWDKLFGTYDSGVDKKYTYGVDDERFNSGLGASREMMASYWSGLSVTARELRKMSLMDAKRTAP